VWRRDCRYKDRPPRSHYAAFLRRWTYSARGPDGGWRAAAALGRGQFTRQEE